MNKIIITILLSFSVIPAFTQFNVLPGFDEDYCHHIKACSNTQKSYYTPFALNSLMEDYDVTFYFLDVAVENNSVYIDGTVTIKAISLVNSLDTFAFELYSGLDINSVYVNDIVQSFGRNDYLVTVPLTSPVPEGNLLTVKIDYQGTPPSGGFFSGITTDYNSDYQKNVTWTLSEPYAARDWWPVKQDLGDKADSVWVFITTSTENKAGSQGLLTATTPMPGGKVRYEWKSYYPIDYYLISMAVADYQEYNIYAHPEGTDDSVLIQNYIYDHPDCLTANQAGIDRTAGFIELFSELFGLYPFIEEKYGHCLTELGGGMEHQTMTTIGGFSFGLVAHELGHMWFGDKVTCATWSDIWINEGFATYSDYLAHSFLSTPYYDSLWLKIRHDQVKALPDGSVYVPPEETGDIWRIFDGRLSYSKGALLLHMIRFELQDDDLFFDILASYVDEYGDSVATGDDFREWVELHSGKDFTDFFNQWYYGEGYPVYNITWNQSGNQLDIISTQTTSAAVTPLFKMLVPYHIIFTDETDTTLLLYQDANLNSFSIPIEKPVEKIELDPDQWILHELNSLSVGDEEKDNPVHFTIGPNPATGRINIYFSHKPVKKILVIISDLSGRNVFEQEMSGSNNSADISLLSPGVYQVSVTDGASGMNRKLIVK
jgi:aminopeptidase N